jgi:asparagine synthase (glutamine-hydrolysing)
MVALGDRQIRRPELLECMGTALRHRGPDGHGTLCERRVAFGAERLRIVDPTPAADQPFADLTSRTWLVCNGEIYNAPALRERYRHYPFRSQSDSEVIIPLFLDRGVAGLAELEGMFALALYDFRDHTLLLARDPAGEKPLFYVRHGHELWFASEVQALLLSPNTKRSLDRYAVSDFLTLGYVREPRTMFAEVRKVEAGTVLSCTTATSTAIAYERWRPAAIATASPNGGLGPLADVIEQAVRKQIAGQEEIGVFASGGVDSGLLAALAVDQLGRERVHLFTAGFTDRTFDESRAARRVAQHLQARHRVVPCNELALREALGTVMSRVAEPIADPAVLPTYLLARVARERVKVVLSGEGADELFGGYPTYLGHRAAGWYGDLPGALRHGMARAIGWLPASHGKVSYAYLLKRFAAAASAPLAQRHISWFGTGLPQAAFLDVEYEPNDRWSVPNGVDPVKQAASFDYRTYLRDNLLVKVDRATMLLALEARAPYLDPGVVRYAQSLDPAEMIRGLTTKWALKRVASHRLPRRVVRQRKRGLSVPVAKWLNGGLRGEVDRVLAPPRLERRGLLRTDVVWQLLSEHRCGRADHARALWPLFILESWMEHWGFEEES